MNRLVAIALLALLGCRVGAADEKAKIHWAFQPIQDPPLPQVTRLDWCRTSVDRFILQRLEKTRVTPAPEAERRTLLRRVSYDLTGLPPTTDEIEAFVKDTAPDAWARVIDRLLDSPHYGEHWGRHWLDVVRYADTAGETADYPVPVAWRYRDYVIASFNADKPYDEFLREQVAGDILAKRGDPERFAERVTATGYLALSRRFGFDSENYHHLTIQDTIDTLGQSVLGLTLGCARCHAHKYDPVSMRDYYALYGIFESTRYAFPGSEQKQKYRALVPLVTGERARAGWRAYEAEMAALAGQLEKAKKSVPGGVLRSLDELDGDFEMQAPAAGGSKGVLVPPWVYEGPIAVTSEAQSPFRNVYPFGRVGASVAPGTNGYRIGQALYPSHGTGFDGVLHINLDFRVATNGTAGAAHRFWMGPRSDEPWFEVFITSDSVTVKAGDRRERIRSIDTQRWWNLQLSADLKSGRVTGSVGHPEDLKTWAGVVMEAEKGGAPLSLFVGLDSDAAQGAALPPLWADNLAVQTEPLLPVSTSPPAPADGVAVALDPDAARRRMESMLAEGPFPMAYAVSEGTPRNARLQARGDPDRAGEEVPRGFIEMLGGDPVSEPSMGSGRLDLAQWLTRPGNPLTARVIVNRVWLYHFGRGLVTTPNDFGLRGQRPSHPELLDHLATEFIRSGWSFKSLHRLILGSATYRQRAAESTSDSGEGGHGALAADCPVTPTGGGVAAPMEVASLGTEVFSPFPRRRLRAEEIRDSILWVSGALEGAASGAHPFPAPTTWGYTQHGPFSATYEHRRRSVFLMTQRLKRHPFLALFDGADPNASTAERRTTTVPTQALFFLNDPFVHELSRQFARRVETSAGQGARRLDVAYQMALGRCPSPVEREEAEAFLADYQAAWSRAGQEPSGVDEASQAALARVLFAGNEFLTID
ncbi:MAG: DUF1549 domain-containing protein [Verrucomicrobiales bacterium]|nr:DUF1549 domain-containing protein [Verrucomicrobiales bacterium]